MEHSVFQPGTQLDPSRPDDNTSWQMTLETLTSELTEAGIDQNYVHQTAAFLFSSIYNHFPLIFSGPAGKILADALSVSMFASTAGTLDASAPYSPSLLREAEEGNDRIIVAENIFSGNWLIPLTQHIQHTHKYFILLHPFPEDLQIEPHSLFRYFHPILTDPLVHKIIFPDFLGGKNLENYIGFESQYKKSAGTLLPILPSVNLYTDRLLKVISDAQQMLGNEDPELVWMLAIFPYAYATGKTSLLSEKLTSQSGISRNTIQRIEEFLKA